MKYLILLFMSFNTYAFCPANSVKQINKCLLENVNEGRIDLVSEEEFAAWKSSALSRLDRKSRVNSIKNFRLASKRCNVSRANLAILKKEMINDQDETLLNCIESKKTEVDLELSLKKSEEEAIDSAKEYLKVYNCNRLSSKFQKNLCIYMKGRM